MKIGDRIRCIARWDDDKVQVGEEGTILAIDTCVDGDVIIARWNEAGIYVMTDEEVELIIDN